MEMITVAYGLAKVVAKLEQQIMLVRQDYYL